MTISLAAIANYLDSYLEVTRFLDEQHGIYRSSSRPVQRIGLAIEPWPAIATWAAQQRLDALFLHRPWRLDLQSFPTDIGILAYHLSFDLTLTFGFNPRLANIVRMSQLVPIGKKDNAALGMLGTIPTTPLHSLLETLTDIFGKAPIVEQAFSENVERIAIVGGMTDSLIREAALHDVQLYITGQFRQPARKAVHDTQMTVAIIGHAEGELWGLQALAGVLRERWNGLEVILAPLPDNQRVW